VLNDARHVAELAREVVRIGNFIEATIKM